MSESEPIQIVATSEKKAMQNIQTATNDLKLKPQMLNEKDAALYLGMSRIWLSQSRMRGTGPVYIKLGRTIRYSISDLDTYLESHRVRRRKY